MRNLSDFGIELGHEHTVARIQNMPRLTHYRLNSDLRRHERSAGNLPCGQPIVRTMIDSTRSQHSFCFDQDIAHLHPTPTQSSSLQFTGTVVANFGSAAAVINTDNPDDNQLYRAIPLKKLSLVVAGDRVVCTGPASDELRISELLPRDTLLARPDRRHQLKPLAANVSLMIIVGAVVPTWETRLIDQFCVVAENAGIQAAILINKTDLIDVSENPVERQAELDAVIEQYQRIGYAAAVTNATAEGGVDALYELLRGHTAVLVGQSGVGKSSIIQHLLPDIDIRTGAISAATGVGAHTTTVSYRYELASLDAALIDSPGVRQFPVDHLSPEDIVHGFRDISVKAAHCRFNDCRHDREPGCAVRAAVDDGTISPDRFNNFRSLTHGQ